MNSLPHSDVPLDFRRLAKAFRQRVLATDQQVLETTSKIDAFAKDILNNRATFRQQHLKDIEKRWQKEIPDQFRCGLVIHRHKTELIIADARLVASTFKMNTWDVDEGSVSLNILELRCVQGRYLYRPQVVATISEHAIGRRYQRAFNNSDAAICADLSHLALNVPSLIRKSTWLCPAGDGAWGGSTLTANTASGPQKLLCARSYLPVEGE